MLETERADAGAPPDAALADLSTETLLRLYKRLLLLRRFEERVYYLFLQGEIPGTVHQYQGQEAVAVGICDHLSATDWITSTHRPHGHAIAKGITPRAALAELYARETGCCRGKGGSMHLGDPTVGMLPAIAIVGGGNTVVTGMGLAFKLRRSGQAAVCFFGEGATNEGAFHEGLNFAAVQHLPIVFVCENNLYGASTPYHQVSLVTDVAERAHAYGVPGYTADGMDVLSVREVGGRAIAEARAGRGPILLECKTYRFIGHSRGDARGYRTRDEEAFWAEKDPILRLGRAMTAAGRAQESDLSRLEDEVTAELDDAVDFARQSPHPAPEQALEDVYA
ncbi:MAG TPA: thiamine pyrophosphate-dependent dehydrogenase E1 component subunit alpha [Armatimonadota bacterium]|nr:thiamine pyrophosphate-dependent dehydrogenase E1 component subunit alpha [Armatimonadota bacterium]